MLDIQAQGFQEMRVKNFWGPGDGYQGINSVFISRTGQRFELQFHTPESLSMKEEECHSSYAKFRSATDSRKMMQYWEEMVSMWDMVPVPEAVLTIPEVVQQKLEFDLSKLSMEETVAIKHRKMMERVCRYPVEELHQRAVHAEAEIGALIVYLVHKHGPGGVCEQKDRRSSVRAQLSMLRQLVDSFIQMNDKDDDPGEDPEGADKPAAADGADDPQRQDPDLPSPATLSHVATVSDKNFSKVRVGVKLASAKSTPAHAGSVDMKNSPSSPRGNKALSRSNGPMMQSVELKSSADLKKEEELLLQQLTKTLPDEPEVRDKLRELECEYPPLKYKVICNSEQMYSLCVHGFLRDIANDADYEIYAVNNWWDDLEKFGAVNARFLAVRHGLRFEVTLHTVDSWDALITHSEYMRRKFDTVIKTDVLFTDNPAKVEKAKEEMRREEMWRERWARITVPDRALTIGTLRYAHVPAPHLHEQQVRAAPSQSPYDSGGAEQTRGVCFTGRRAAGGGAVAPGQHARREATAHRRQQGPRWGAYDEGDGEFRLEAGERVAGDVGLG